MDYWKTIKKTLDKWDEHLLRYYPMAWELRIHIVLPIIFGLFVVFLGVISLNSPSSFLQAKHIVPEGVGLLFTPQTYFMTFGIINGLVFLVWVLYQSRYNYWLNYGRPIRRSYPFAKSTVVFFIFLLSLLAAYIPAMILARKGSDYFLVHCVKRPSPNRTPFRTEVMRAYNQRGYQERIVQDSVGRLLKKIEELPSAKPRHLLELMEIMQQNYCFTDSLKMDSIGHTLSILETEHDPEKQRSTSRTLKIEIEGEFTLLGRKNKWFEEAMTFYLFANYPAYYWYILKNVPKYWGDDKLDINDRDGFLHLNYRNYWFVFAIFFFPFLVQYLLWYFQFFKVRVFVWMCICVLLCFLFYWAQDLIKIWEWIENPHLKFTITYSFWAMLLLVVAGWVLRYLFSRRKGTLSVFLLAGIIFPLMVLCFSNLIIATGGFSYLFTGERSAYYILGPFFSIILTAFAYFILSPLYLKLLYRLFLLPRE